jgi:YD repeat-containing protein
VATCCCCCHVAALRAGEAAQTLVRYEYDEQGDLRRVHNRAGDVVRQFAYHHPILVENSQPDGLVGLA